MAFLTGRYPRTIGVLHSRTTLPKGEVTIGTLLRHAGYEAFAIGKTHHYTPLRREFDRCVDLDEHREWLAGRGACPLSPGVEVLGPWRPFRDPARVWLNSGCLPYGAVDANMSGTWFARVAEEFLLREHASPFFLLVNFYEPHSPFRFPVEYRDRFPPASFTVPEIRPEDRDQAPRVFAGLTDDEKRGTIAACYTSVEFMDKNVGLVLDALDRSAHAADTLVLFNSDHGCLLGQHGRFEKHCCFEEAVRVALLVRAPGLIPPGSQTSALVQTIDIVPTILELCGVETPRNLQGRSLVHLVRDPADRHREHAIAEYAGNEEAMIRTDRWKLVYATGRRTRRDGYAPERPRKGRDLRLYDLAEDPSETTNVAGRPEHADLVAELLVRLSRHLKSTSRHPESIPDTPDALELLDRCLTTSPATAPRTPPTAEH
jgi:choline-sulfatase